MKPCADTDHVFEYAGVRFCDGARSMPGTGARRRYYANVYFCTKCIHTQGVAIEDPHQGGDGRPSYNSYQKILFDAVPGGQDECCVPVGDR